MHALARALPVAALIATALPATAGSATSRTCAAKGTEVLASNRYGDVYRPRGDTQTIRWCGTNGKRGSDFHADGYQSASVDVGGHFFAYASAALCDDPDSTCITNILTGSLDGRGGPTGFTEIPVAGTQDRQYDLAQLRIAGNQALVWIVCETTYLPKCRESGQLRSIYARPARNARRRGLDPILITKGRDIDPNYLSLSANGRTVRWRAGRTIKTRGIGK